MEFMMIRSVKSAAAGTSGGDLSKPTLGLISGGTSGSSSSSSSASNHHNNLYQHHHAATASPFTQASSLHSHSSQQQQQQQYQQPQQHSSSSSATLTTHSNSYGGIKFSNQARAPTQNSTGDYNSWKRTLFSSQSTSQNLDAFGSSQGLKKKSPMMVMPILIKNKDTLDRISSSNCVQNSNSGFFGGSSATSVNSSASALGVYSGQQRQAKSTLNVNSNSFGVALCSNRFQTDSPKKMNKLLWETSHQKVSAEAANGFPADVPSTQMTGEGDAGSRKRKQPQTFEVNSIFSSSSSSKKQKLEKKSSLHMPNLLKWLSNGGKSGDAKQRNKSSDNSLVRSINSFKSPCTSLVPVRTGIPIENVFLKKYDPIKLLKRLRCSTSGKTTTAAIVKSVVTPKRKKLVTINNFPSDGNPRAHRAHKSTVTTRGRKKKRKRNTPAQSNALTWTPTQGALQVSRNLRKNKKAPIRLPKHCKPKRKVNVKYRSHGGNSFYGPHSEDRLRVIAAVYLKRDLARLRTGGKVKTSVIRRRLRKLKEWRRMHKAVHNNSTLGGALVKTGNSACQRSGPLTKFFVTNSNLPSPMPIETYSYSLVEHPYQMHTLQLLRHKRELQDRLETIEADGTVQKVGSLPEKPEDGNKVPFLYDNMLLKKRQVKHVISQKLLICLSTVGFTHTKLRPLEVMADATSNFMTKLAQRLRAVSEMEMYGVDHGFPDAMERVLSENGLGGIRGLEEFYRTKVNDYGHRMEDQCLLLRRQYAYKVRSKVGMMSNVNTSSTSSISAASSSSSSSVTTISAPSSTITSNNISSTVPHAPPSLMVVSGGGGTSIAATGAVASKSVLMAKTSSSSSQPLSPGNSVLAEMLSSQEDLSARTPQGCPSSPSLGMMVGSGGSVERQLEELMGAPPPNVEIRPNSFPHPHHPHQHRPPHLVQQQQQQQQVPLHQLLASLSQQQQSPQSRSQQQSLLPPPSPQQQQTLNQYVNTLYASSPPLTPPTPPHHLNQKMYQPQQPHQASPQGQPQNQQSHLTQLLQRPITSQQSPTHQATTTSHHLILHHHHPQSNPPQQANQYHHPLHQSHLTSPSQQSPARNTNISTTTITANKNSPSHHPSQASHQSHPGAVAAAPHQSQGSRQLVQTPLQLNLAKAPVHHSSLASGETTYSSNTITPSAPVARTAANSNGTPSPSLGNMQGGGKLITIIRSSSSGPTQPQGIMVNSNHHHKYQDAASVTGGTQDNNVISINLGGHADMDTGGDIGASPISSSTSSTSSSSSKAKLKEAISQRNLLRLNFEQVPSGAGDSTVLLSSSSVAAAASAPPPVANTNNSVQFIGKVSGSAAGGGQSVSWNNTTNYS